MKPNVLSKDAEWLCKELVKYMEFKMPNKARFSKMGGEAFAHALMMVYGVYLKNQMQSKRHTITPIRRRKRGLG